MRAVIYARFSSDRQNEDSIVAQVRACTEYAQQHGITVVGTYADEAISGRESKTQLRQEYQRMLRDAKKNIFDMILIHKYDRVARSLLEHVNLAARLKKEKIDLIAVAQDFGTTKEAEIIKALMWSMSEYYIENLASETKKGLRETALKGLHNGGYAPFGYDVVDRQYVINELEAAYVRKMFDCALNRKGFTDLLAEMKDKGITGKRGKEIKYTQVYEILHNEKYTGVYVYSPNEEESRMDRRTKPNAIRIEGGCPAIIDKTTFQEVQKIMKAREHAGRRGNYLCGGIVYCANCGAKMHVHKSERKGHTYLYYACSSKCGAATVKLEDVDETVKAYIRELLSEDTRAKVAQILRTYKGHEQDRVEGFKAAIKKKVEEKETAYNNLIANMSSAVLPPEVAADLSEKMVQLKREIKELEEAEPPADYTVDTIHEWLQSIRTAPDEKAVHLLIERIEAKRTENKTDLNIISTLKPVLENVVAGGRLLHFPRYSLETKYNHLRPRV